MTHSLLTQIINTTYLLCNKKEEAKHEIHSNNLALTVVASIRSTNATAENSGSHLALQRHSKFHDPANWVAKIRGVIDK